jgi:hypothetical protein
MCKALTNLILLLCFFMTAGGAFAAPEGEIPKLDNPMSVQYLKKNLRKSHPRLVLNASTERTLKAKLRSEPVVQNVYEAIKLNAKGIFDKPLLERIQTGRRLLSVSREMLYRVNMLGMVYRIEKKPDMLKRLNEEVIAVCNFSDWNPSHYLDLGEVRDVAEVFVNGKSAGILWKKLFRVDYSQPVSKKIHDNPSN